MVEGSLTSRLSQAALQYVEAFESDDPVFMAERFYAYYTFPASRAWRARLASRRETASFIGIVRQRVLRVEWTSANVESDSWFAWRRPDPNSSAAPRFKLYVSPHCGDLPEVFAVAARVFTESDAVAFKVGNSAGGVLRPDKLIAYFANYSALAHAASALEKLVPGARVHGVPFSCQLDATGLLSWGVDPITPANAGDGGAISWRRWVAARLASRFVEGRKSAASDVAQYALDALGAEGVDVGRWIARNAGP